MYSLMAYSEQPHLNGDPAAMRRQTAQPNAQNTILDTIGTGFALLAIVLPMLFVAGLLIAEQAARTAGADNDKAPMSVEQVISDQTAQSLL